MGIEANTSANLRMPFKLPFLLSVVFLQSSPLPRAPQKIARDAHMPSLPRATPESWEPPGAEASTKRPPPAGSLRFPTGRDRRPRLLTRHNSCCRDEYFPPPPSGREADACPRLPH